MTADGSEMAHLEGGSVEAARNAIFSEWETFWSRISAVEDLQDDKYLAVAPKGFEFPRPPFVSASVQADVNKMFSDTRQKCARDATNGLIRVWLKDCEVIEQSIIRLTTEHDAEVEATIQAKYRDLGGFGGFTGVRVMAAMERERGEYNALFQRLFWKRQRHADRGTLAIRKHRRGSAEWKALEGRVKRREEIRKAMVAKGGLRVLEVLTTPDPCRLRPDTVGSDRANALITRIEADAAELKANVAGILTLQLRIKDTAERVGRLAASLER